MINQENFTSWEGLIEGLDKVETLLGDRADKLLYRGQTNSSWKLETTLERNFKSPVTLNEYYWFALLAKARIETFTDTTWNIPDLQGYENWLKEKDALNFSPFLAYDYLAYLRHHGYPSPLLDWSASPYIALFFAFNDRSNKTGSVSLYSYLEYVGSAKTSSTNEPQICAFGPYVKVHRRHVLQQSQYTICVQYDSDCNPLYANHEQVFDRPDKGQDMLWKFNIPVTERPKALKALNRMNINAFSLFGSEDSLVETIATNEIIKRGL